ncbi:MAG: dynamin family protein [Dehalococcoidia bacterium]
MVGQQHRVIAQGQEWVLEEFAGLRGDILALLDRGEQIGGVLGANAGQIAPLFAAARRNVDLSRLNLTVIGAEGVGKSTLINAIAGAELTPRERDHPGTVAPTYAEASETAQPEFSVVLRADSGAETVHHCADIEEFRRYLLQYENRENVRGVVRGIVRYNHPVLRRGLRLVDMPGVHASSPLVNQEAKRFLAEETHAVVAVTYGRTGFGALHEVFDDLAVQRDLVQAVVINQELGYFATSNLALLPDIDLRTKLSETRRAAAEELDIPEERIFILNLASFYGSRVNGEPPLDSPAHEEEIARFQRHLWGYMRENGVAEVIDRAADDATTALHALYSRLDVAGRAFTALTVGDKGAAKRIASEFKSARGDALSAWRKVSNTDVAAAVAAQHWPALKTAADHARDTIATAIDAVIGELTGSTGRVSGRQASAWKQRLQTDVWHERDALDEAYGNTLRAVLAYYTAHADGAMARVYEQVPLLAESAPADRMVVGGAGFRLAQLGRIEPGVVEQIAKWGTAGGAATLGGNLAGGGGTAVLVTMLGMNPLAALAIGGAAGASATLMLWRLARDEHRDALEGGLTRYRGTALGALDTSPGGPLRQEWLAAVETVAARVGDSLDGQLAEVAALLTSPEGASAGALRTRHLALQESMTQIDALRAELDSVRARAEVLNMTGMQSRIKPATDQTDG